MDRILCAVDFSEGAPLVLKQALNLAALSGGNVEVVHVCNVPPYFGPELMVWVDAGSTPLSQVAEEAARARLAALLAELTPEERARTTTSIEFGPPADALLRVAKDRESNLIVMGTHGRTGLGHVMLGSVAERVVRSSHCPVLVVRP
ncbi:MAG: universal stress protein [Polyangiaceae bacterium]|nr:universal stress protein [Polyangiaceae bacterium]